ncbi:unnamed protein product [Pleuronectes platessa]|uniref:Uncharacterized protein n=1 Tax=Pleuronectes platessa TaxID=8262 RepID=A0A9N7W0B7_PLEPL|nr:unnamed protein product [Pleuronectes platessa]
MHLWRQLYTLPRPPPIRYSKWPHAHSLLSAPQQAWSQHTRPPGALVPLWGPMWFSLSGSQMRGGFQRRSHASLQGYRGGRPFHG